jgi:uncharacterized membrane protein YgcG
MVQVCKWTTTKNNILQTSLDEHKHMYIIARREFDKVTTVGLTTRPHSAWKLMLPHRVLALREGGGGGAGGAGGGGGGGVGSGGGGSGGYVGNGAAG